MTPSPEKGDTPGSRLATRLSFFISGFGTAAWAPLVPYVKARLSADEAELGLLLLCLGVGSIVAMPIAGALAGRIGSRKTVAAGAFGIAAALPLLALSPSTAPIAVLLFLFGASIGAINIGANVHALKVQEAAGRPLMSNFHGLYSVGGLAGSAGMSGALSGGLDPFASAILASAVVILSIWIAAPRFLRTRTAPEGPAFVRPEGPVLLIGTLAFIMFLVEGAMLDWGAVYLNEIDGVAASRAGFGYALFAAAMTIGRFTGDAVAFRLGDRAMLIGGALLATAGLGVIVSASPPVSLAGFLLVGLGASNIVPLLFSRAGRQKAMPPGLAIAAVSSFGYAGVLLGPAFVGFLGKVLGLPAAFLILAAMALVVAASARRVTRGG
ncbi:MFS transporter [Afifella sp. IM 167]|uniref:MFS transporter n=1 Tax=Afifella sp. IM 167 TaxID=2033586 RepID=UPI001CC955DF|nr:MFS transporter [Afifella sp. IM 167]MBZ8134223.1 MFS transporter [Afifella sp. IM 167]